MVLEIPKELKGKELTAYLTGKLMNLQITCGQDTEQIFRVVKKWNNGFPTYSMCNTLLAMVQQPDFTLLTGYKA